MKPFSPLLFVMLVSAPVFAAEPPKLDCPRPVIPQVNASDFVNKMFNKRVTQFKACITKYVDEQTAIAKNNPDLTTANAAHDAAEAAIKEHNDFLEELNEHNKAAGADDDDSNKEANNKPQPTVAPPPAPMKR